MAKLALFSSDGIYPGYTLASYDAYRHMLAMTGKEVPVIGEIKTYKTFQNIKAKYRMKNVKIYNRIIFSVYDYKNKGALEELMNCDIIYLEGGNTFEISFLLQETGMYDFLKKFSAKGGVICGTSAGSIMCTPSILTAQWADNPYRVEDKIKSYDGLSLTNFCLKPHSQGYMPKYLNKFQDFCNMSGVPFKCIPDGSAVIVDDDKIYEYGDVNTLTPY